MNKFQKTVLTFVAKAIGINAALAGNALNFVPFWNRYAWRNWLYPRMVSEGYKANDAVFNCIQCYLFTYPAAIPVVYGMDNKPMPNHPAQQLLVQPNPWMTWADLTRISILYRAIGGDCYLHKYRSGVDGRILQLRPYSDGAFTVIPSPQNFIDSYRYDIGDGNPKSIAPQDIVHQKWPSPDPDEPWKAQSPILAIARQINTDTELTRYSLALLMNDATPPTVFTFKEGDDAILSDETYEDMKGYIENNFSGDNRGKPMVVRGNVNVSRLGLAIKELAPEILRDTPESRIASAYRIPPIVAGLNIGLKQSLYHSYQEPRLQWYEDTLIPMWNDDAETLTKALADEYPGFPKFTIRMDTSHIPALVEKTMAMHTTVTGDFKSGLIFRDEGRAMLNLPLVDGGEKVWYEPTNVILQTQESQNGDSM